MKDFIELPGASVIWHALVAVLTVTYVQLVGADWRLWFPTIASFVFSTPIFVNYLSGIIGPRFAWSMIFVNLVLSIFIMSQVHIATGISFSGPPCGEAATCISHNWTDGIYFSIVTFTTLGYGDYQPVEYGRYFAAAQALGGYLVLGLTVGAVLHWANERKALRDVALSNKSDD